MLLHLMHTSVAVLLLALGVTADSIDDLISQDIQTIASGQAIEPANGSAIAVTENEVTFSLFTRQQTDVAVNESNIDAIESGKPVKFIAHGWNEDGKTTWYYPKLTDALLKKGDYNVIQVYWGQPAHQVYNIAAQDTRGVGYLVASFVLSINKKISLDKFQLIGHSLGAHVMGFAGKKVKEQTGSKIRRITGLDPAGPLFETPQQPKANRLSNTDEKIVEIVHTDDGIFGYAKPLGTIDFYANGGGPIQPGCFPEVVLCSHQKSCAYYIEALNEGGLTTTKCDSWLNYESGSCSGNPNVTLGSHLTPQTRGVYYFDAVSTDF